MSFQELGHLVKLTMFWVKMEQLVKLDGLKSCDL
jgi:hypothetical protein